MIETCNVYECLRKFKENGNDLISDYCGIYDSKKQNQTIHNSKECPFFCDKFWDYELEKEITKHEEVHWISDDIEDKNSERTHNMFVGISTEGKELQEKREKWENAHEDCDTVICPYCDYEYEHGEDTIPYENGEEELRCPMCHKEFNCNVEVTYLYSTEKLEEYEEEVNEL